MTQSTPISNRNRLHLSSLLEQTAATVGKLGTEFDHYRCKLTELNSRYSEGRFHLAVLGQFKRGKSTLLNALIGEPILPMGVVPVTAAPTFIQYAELPKITVQYQGGQVADEFSGVSTEERSAYLNKFVTEEGNPQNRLDVAEVQIDLPAPILKNGVVLIDTPRIGSTYRHNTLATLNFLEQCDSAMFLISADPPITEVELEFLRQVREKIPRLFFVMNKIDYLDESELEQALSFYKRVLSEQIEWDGEIPVFCVSARKGLDARTDKDLQNWTSSGLEQLESFLVEFLAGEKFNALMDAVLRRSIDFIDAILMEAGIALQALQLPSNCLKKK